MKLAQADILIVPGYKNSGPDHWQSRWQEKISSARRLVQDDWHKPEISEWTAAFEDAIAAGDGKPIVCVAHSLGCQTLVQAVLTMKPDLVSRIAGAFLVAPPDVENPAIRPKHLMTFGPYPRKNLPFPSMVLGSTDDPFCSSQVAQDMANAWGSFFIDARESGHIDSTSGHGPWPDGMMVFANFMSKLKL